MRAWYSIAVVALAMLIASLTSVHGAAVRGSVSLSDLAPADEYFGRLKLSPFGIRHEIYTLESDLYHGRRSPDAIAHDAELVEDALHDWTARFPHDPWLPAAAWNLATLYRELPGAEAHTHAAAAVAFVREHFPQSPYGQSAKTMPSSPPAVATASPAPAETPNDAPSLVAAILAQHDVAAAQTLEARYWTLSRGGGDPSYARCAWELAALYERLPGEDARRRAIRLLALLVDRYGSVVYGKWAMRDLERGLGVR